MDETVTVAGFGCRMGAGVGEVLAALDASLAAHALSRAALGALATVPRKRGEAGLNDAAALLGLPLLVPDAASLAAAATPTESPASRAATGAGSAAEAAALVAAGLNARLLGRRLVTGPVTCALAVGGP